MTRKEYEEKVISVARTWVGVLYLQNGRTRSQGVDCLGLLLAFYAELGMTVDYKQEFYKADWYQHTPEERYLDGLRQYGLPIEPEQILPGDVLYFRTGLLARAPIHKITHAGIAIGTREFIHSLNRKPVRISSLDEPAWTKTYAGAMRVKMVMELLEETSVTGSSTSVTDEVTTVR